MCQYMPISTKTDRRVLRTRAALRQALMELIREKGYEALTVEEITQHANLGRATFYLHYRDKDDLLLEEFSLAGPGAGAGSFRSLLPIGCPNWSEGGIDAEQQTHPAVFDGFPARGRQCRTIPYPAQKPIGSNRIAGRIREILIESINQFVQTKAKTDPIPILV
jgi:hypothetical protein